VMAKLNLRYTVFSALSETSL